MTLFIDGCMRENSRTRELAQAVLAHLGGETETLVLAENGPAGLTPETLAQRDKLLAEGALDAPLFARAHQFAAADTIVLAAPYWDLLFPAAVRAYFEAITVSGITFRYDDHGVPRSLCRARRLVYVTTAGGPIIGNYGFQYVEAMARGFFGIETVQCLAAEGLDIIGADVAAILAEAKSKIAQL
ncbi:MAG: NAD(P)H-dependent oxidoreductase [Oscillospiraceae bacterium]|nr:NAD(P)H-dependent oxidoreductase [Oscillospiraceae bacterium]